jgi:hypothetical protein
MQCPSTRLGERAEPVSLSMEKLLPVLLLIPEMIALMLDIPLHS